MLILAVAVTAMVCVGGSYMVFGGNDSGDTRISVSGSTTVQPLMDAWQIEYEKEHRVALYVSGGGSDAGPTNMINGIADLGMRSSGLSSYAGSTPAERAKLKEFVIAYDAVVIMINADVTGVTSLTPGQLKSIFNGSVTNWNQVGGNNLAVKIVVREPGSGTRDTFDKMVMIDGVTGSVAGEAGNSKTIAASASIQSTTGAVMTAVKGTSGAIGYVNMDMIPEINADAKLKSVNVNGVAPTDTTVQNKINDSAGSKYELSRKLYIVTYDKPSADVIHFIEWMYTKEAQKIVKAKGFVPLPSSVISAELVKIAALAA